MESNLSINARGNNWDANYKIRYISGMDSFTCLSDPSDCYAPTVPSMVYHDISCSYMMSETVTLAAGVNVKF